MKIVIAGFLALLACGTQALEIRDQWQQGATIRGQVEPGSKVEFLGRDVRVAKGGQFVVGVGRDFPAKAELTVVNPAGERKVHTFNVAARKYNIQEITGVPQATVTPSPEQVERSRREAELVSAARKKDLATPWFTSDFAWPVVGRISGVYGSQRVYNGKPGNPHFGIDIAAPTGTKVLSPTAGLVTLVHADMFFSGGTLIVDHGHGLSSTFIHLSKILVKEGDQITKGQVIAEVGATGRATGPHLDWRINWFDQRLDPSLVVGPMPKSAK